MFLTSNEILIICSLLVMLSYLYNYVSRTFKIPSVLLLISTGIILKLLAKHLGIQFLFPQSSLELMGTLGLILIVLEASLELNLSKEEMPHIKNAFFASFIILVISIICIGMILYLWLGATFKKSIINAIPLAVISSAIAIPSVSGLNKQIKNFIIYESTFSDILGILFFNYAIQDKLMTLKTISTFGLNFILIIFISFSGSILLIFLINKINHHIKFFLIFSILLLLYAIGKEFHLPSLLLILVFGLMINNSERFLIRPVKKFFNPDKLKSDLIPFKTITDETAFLIRTFFFILFGYSVNLDDILDFKILFTGFVITASFLLIRYVYLRFTVKESFRIIKLFLAPRGLITVILFYSIPSKYIIAEFSIGIVFMVIIITALMMTISLWKKLEERDLEN